MSRTTMNSTGRWIRAWLLAALTVLILCGCNSSDQRAVETQVARAAQTAIAEGQRQAATYVPAVKETAVAVAATQAVEIKQTAVAAAATQAVEIKQTTVAVAATQAARLKLTAEAEIATRLPTRAPGVSSEVQAAREKLKAMPAMRSPWTQVDAPIQSVPGERSAGRYADVIDQFDVSSEDFAGRYRAGGAGSEDTRCNIFAGDVMRAMGVPLPTKGNLGKGQGAPGATYTDPMTAQAPLLNDYLNRRLAWVTSESDPGVWSDWQEIKPDNASRLAALIAHVNAGKPALVSDQGHIAVIRPSQPPVQSWQDLIIAQAGAVNFLAGPLRGHFSGTPQFFIHD